MPCLLTAGKRSGVRIPKAPQVGSRYSVLAQLCDCANSGRSTLRVTISPGNHEQHLPDRRRVSGLRRVRARPAGCRRAQRPAPRLRPGRPEIGEEASCADVGLLGRFQRVSDMIADSGSVSDGIRAEHGQSRESQRVPEGGQLSRISFGVPETAAWGGDAGASQVLVYVRAGRRR
jgi:hypothetical protein